MRLVGLLPWLLWAVLASCSDPTPATPTATPSPVPTATYTPVPTATATAVPTATPTAKPRLVPTATATPTPSPTATAVPTATAPVTPSPVPTATPTPTPTATAAPTPTPTFTPIPTATATPTPSPTATAVATATPTATPSPVPTAMATPVPTFTPTPIATATAIPTPTFTPLDSREAKDILNRVGGFPAKGGKLITPEGATIVNSVDELFHVFETGHSLLTGEPSRWIPRVLTSEEFRALLREKSDVELLDAVAWCCERTDAGLELILNGDRKAYGVLASIAHEAGHARQRTLNANQTAPSGTDPRNSNFGALHEAQAFAFAGAIVRKIGEYTGINATYLPTRYLLTDWVEGFISRTRKTLDDPAQQHQRGEALLWGAVLGDPDLADLKRELLDDGILSSDSLLRLHDHLVLIERDEADAYVAEWVDTFDREARLIKSTILRRDASISDEGFFEHVYGIFLLP